MFQTTNQIYINGGFLKRGYPIPLNHPCYFRIFHHYTIQLLGYPNDYGNIQMSWHCSICGNLAPVDRWSNLLFIGFQPSKASKVVQDFATIHTRSMYSTMTTTPLKPHQPEICFSHWHLSAAFGVQQG